MGFRRVITDEKELRSVTLCCVEENREHCKGFNLWIQFVEFPVDKKVNKDVEKYCARGLGSRSCCSWRRRKVNRKETNRCTKDNRKETNRCTKDNRKKTNRCT